MQIKKISKNYFKVKKKIKIKETSNNNDQEKKRRKKVIPLYQITTILPYLKIYKPEELKLV